MCDIICFQVLGVLLVLPSGRRDPSTARTRLQWVHTPPRRAYNGHCSAALTDAILGLIANNFYLNTNLFQTGGTFVGPRWRNLCGVGLIFLSMITTYVIIIFCGRRISAYLKYAFTY